MWSKTLFLTIRVRVLTMKHRIRLVIPAAVYVLSGLVLSCDALLCLIPGNVGRQVRGMIDTVHGIVYEIMDSTPQTFVHVDTEDEESRVLVDVRTTGFGEREEM